MCQYFCSASFVYSEGGLKGENSTVLLTQFEGVVRTFDVGARDDELGAAYLAGAVDDAGQIIWMFLVAMIAASEDGIREVDTDLVSWVVSQGSGG